MQSNEATREREYFTLQEAKHLVEKRYESTHPYANVPPGTVGRVSGLYHAGTNMWGVDITWEGVPGGSPIDIERGGLTDGFSRRDLLLRFPSGERAMVPIDGGA